MEEEGINLIIKTINNDVYNIPVTNSTPIYRLKDAIRESTSIEIDRQRLIYRGKVLTDETFIRDYNIEDGHTVHMVARPSNYREMQHSVSSSSGNSFSRTPVEVSSRQERESPASMPATMTSRLPTSNTEVRNDNIPAADIAPPPAAAPAAPAEANLEYIRQGLLTMHTLFSTINTVDVNAPSSRSSGSKTEVIAERKPSADEAANNNPSQLSSERRFFVGQWLDVRDTVSQWLEATVLDIDSINRRIFVHYNGWPQRWDEWIAFDSPRIAPFRSRTNHSAVTSNFSPTPNISVAHAPSTGVNDLRTILPELASLFRMLQPVVNELAELSEESLNYNRPSLPSTSQLAPGMPWENYINSNSTEDVPADDSKDIPAEKGSSEKCMEVPDSKDSLVTNQASHSRPHLSEQEVDARFQLIARDACPLFDRFGRILSDLSPHLWSRAMPGINRPIPANRFDPFQSLESRLLSLLRERPPSPPPIQAYRAPISSQGPRIEPMDMLRGGLLRPSSAMTDESEANNGGGHNEPPASRSTGSSAASNGRRSSGMEHHVDIHIAILSPPVSNRPNVDSLSRTVANLTASLQAQAQHLAARTQELSERTSAVSEITSAITEALRSGINAESSTATGTATQTQTTDETNRDPTLHDLAVGDDFEEEIVEILNPIVNEGTGEFDEDYRQDEHEKEGDDDDSIPSLMEFCESPQKEDTLLDDLNVHSVEQNDLDTRSLMPSTHDQSEQLPFWNIPNQSIQQHSYGTNDTNNDREDSIEEEESQGTSTFLQRLRRSFFSR